MIGPDEYQDSLVIFYSDLVREIDQDEFEELQDEFAELAA